MSILVFVTVVLVGALAQARAEVNGWPWYRAVPCALFLGLVAGFVVYSIGEAL